MPYIYLLESDGYHKIGSANDVKARLKTLQTGNPREIKLVSCVESNDRRFVYFVEKLMHKCLKKYKVSGEWFILPEKVRAIVYETFSQIGAGNIDSVKSLTSEWKAIL